MRRAFDYYAHPPGIVLADSCEAAADDGPPPRDLWVAAGRDWDGRVAECLARLSRRYRETEHRGFVGVELWRLERLDGR